MSTQTTTQVHKALLVRLQARPGREDDVEALLHRALSTVESEPGTVRWFAVRFGVSSFGIFDAFPDEDARRAHLTGAVGAALAEHTGDLFEQPTVEELDVVAEKQPA